MAAEQVISRPVSTHEFPTRQERVRLTLPNNRPVNQKNKQLKTSKAKK
jgi:hypothetical protein